MRELCDTAAPRRPTSLSLNADLVAKAEAERLDLSAIAEAATRKALAEAARARFREEIAWGVDAYHRYLDEHGSLADAVRKMRAEGEID